MIEQLSRADRIARIPGVERRAFYAGLSDAESEALLYDWSFWGRPSQQLPAGEWTIWLILTGRGFGKTRAGAETVYQWVREGSRLIALVGRTVADVRDTMLGADDKNPSGILNVGAPSERPEYIPSKRMLRFPSGAVAMLYSADEPKLLRGPQHEKAWVDELAQFQYPEAWDQLLLGLRLGDKPQVIVTTTPRPIAVIRGLVKDPTCHVTRGSTYENVQNLAPQFRDRIIARYEGTARGRQELLGEIVDEVAGALWAMRSIDSGRVAARPDRLVRIVVAVDPPSGGLSKRDATPEDSEEGAECGIVVAGLGADGDAYVLEDASMRGSPAEWATAAVAAYRRWRADRIVAEVNNGGQMVGYTVLSVDPTVAFGEVWASEGKRARAEPVAALYEPARSVRRPRVHHVGALAELEDQMTSWIPTRGRSPDRVDALVWAISSFYFSDEPAREIATAVEEDELVRISPY